MVRGRPRRTWRLPAVHAPLPNPCRVLACEARPPASSQPWAEGGWGAASRAPGPAPPAPQLGPPLAVVTVERVIGGDWGWKGHGCLCDVLNSRNKKAVDARHCARDTGIRVVSCRRRRRLPHEGAGCRHTRPRTPRPRGALAVSSTRLPLPPAGAQDGSTLAAPREPGRSVLTSRMAPAPLFRAFAGPAVLAGGRRV